VSGPPLAGSLRLPDLPAGALELWQTIFDLCDRLAPDEWVLVGGQMVMAHGLAAGRAVPRVSRDIDVMANLITSGDALHRCVHTVRGLGFEGQPSMDGRSLHRFARPADELVIDVLAPDHAPPKRRLTTVPPRMTIAVEGGRQAMTRAVVFDASLGERSTLVPVPSVLGALILKAAAYRADSRDRERHATDAAFLVSLIDDPIAIRSQFAGSDRRRLLSLDRRIGAAEHSVWRQLGEYGPDAYTGWRLLLA
jgi:hypothetical protein